MRSEKRSLKELAISNSGLVFDPVSGMISTANPIGLLIIRALNDGRTPEEICESILSEYDADRAMVRKDLNNFIKQLAQLGYMHD